MSCGGVLLCYNKDRVERREKMLYKKVTSRNNKWFFMLRYSDLKNGLEMWSTRTMNWQYFDYNQSRSLRGILGDHEMCVDITEAEAEQIIKEHR